MFLAKYPLTSETALETLRHVAGPSGDPGTRVYWQVLMLKPGCLGVATVSLSSVQVRTGRACYRMRAPSVGRSLELGRRSLCPENVNEWLSQWGAVGNSRGAEGAVGSRALQVAVGVAGGQSSGPELCGGRGAGSQWQKVQLWPQTPARSRSRWRQTGPLRA